MKNILAKIPAIIKNIAILCFGFLLLLNAFDFFQEFINKVIIIVAILMIIYSFIELNGPSMIMSLFGKKNASNDHTSYSSDDRNDDDLF